jgi:heptosyltransferase-3
MSYGDYPSLDEVKKILIIKLRHLGDVLLTTPIFEILKKNRKNTQIDAYVYKESLPILEGNPYISNIFTYDKKIKKLNFFKYLLKEIKFLKFIKNQKYDLIMNLTEGDRGAIASKFSHAKYRVGYNIGKHKKVYTHRVKIPTLPRHTVEKNLDFLRRIGIFPKVEERNLFFKISLKVYEKMKKIVDKDFVLIHPSSRWRFKCLPICKMKKLSKKLIEKGKFLVFTSGMEEFEKKMVFEIVSDLDEKNFLNLSGKTSIKELGALIDMSEMLISVDSLPLHIASFFKKRCVVFFGPSSDKNWGPWKNENARVILEKGYSCRPCNLDGCGGGKVSDCLENISDEKIFEGILSCLG